MKYNSIKYIMSAAVVSMALASCDDFLDRPAEDTYNAGNFYQNNEQCLQGVNYLYNLPWSDFSRSFKGNEIMAGNYYEGDSPYLTLSVGGTNQILNDGAASLWSINAQCNTVYRYIKGANADQSVKNQCMGEALTWKAMGYFFLVRTFGDVPIVHDNTSELSTDYNNKPLVEKADVYEYIIMTLEKAMELLPKATKWDGRIDYYAAEGLLAKVYLTKAGVSGSLNQDDLDKAAMYAKDVIDNSGRQLMADYRSIFQLKNNKNQEALISWHWDASADPWTTQSFMQSDYAPKGFDEFGDCWAEYSGVAVDLQEAFGVSALNDPAMNQVSDTRRKATMMLAGDVFDDFWTDKGGFNLLKFIYDKTYNSSSYEEFKSATGAYPVKNLYGDAADHLAALGVSAGRMANGLATHILRLSDVYLILAEAKLHGPGSTTSDPDALAAFTAVRQRAISSYHQPNSISWEDVWKERRLEFAFEGDRWYDYVRRAYYDPQGAIDDIKAQHRNTYWNVDTPTKNYYESGTWSIDPTSTRYDDGTPAPNISASSFTLPFPTTDVVFNPHLLEEPVHVDVRSEYSY